MKDANETTANEYNFIVIYQTEIVVRNEQYLLTAIVCDYGSERIYICDKNDCVELSSVEKHFRLLTYFL